MLASEARKYKSPVNAEIMEGIFDAFFKPILYQSFFARILI